MAASRPIPDFGRAKLNIATMKPSLVFVDRRRAP
jgi:hypothetical protein